MGKKITSILVPIWFMLLSAYGGSTYDFQVEEGEASSVLFARLQELRKAANPASGSIFMTPEVARLESGRSFKLTNLPEERIMQFLCKVVNAGYHQDDFGNYYVVAPGEKFNRFEDGRWVQHHNSPSSLSNPK